MASEHYQTEFYKAFRDQSAVAATVEFAHKSNWRGVEVMFTLFGKQTLPHRLAILSQFPETTSPYEYK